MKLELKINTERETREYSVLNRIILQGTRYKNGGSDSVKTSDVSLMYEKASSSKRHVKYQRMHLKKDGKRSFSNPVEHYYLKVEDPMNILDLHLTPEGQFDELLNYDEVMKRWGYTKIYLDKYFVSDDEQVLDTIHGWTNLVDSRVKDKRQFFKILQEDLLLSRLFYGYYMDYGESGCYVHNVMFPNFFGSSKLVLQETLRLEKSNRGNRVTINGLINDVESDVNAICEYIGVELNFYKQLSFLLTGKCDFDEEGLLTNLEFHIKAELTDKDFKKEIILLIDKDNHGRQ